MAQRGRPRKTDTRPNASTDTRTTFRCSRCGREYKQQRGNFPYNQSSLYDGNNHYSTICFTCVDELYIHYTNKLGTEEAAARRICSKLDLYFSPSVFEMCEKSNVEASRMGIYASKLGLVQYKNKTYDTTLDEEYDSESAENNSTVPVEIRQFFGDGFSDAEYRYLDGQYKGWTAQYECRLKAQQELFKNLAFSQLNILHAQRDGKKVAEAMKAFQDLLGSAAIKPSQRNDNTFADQNTFGTLIRKWEDTRPIPEPDPEWKDVDGIVHFITVYFIGHLCKMLGLKNRYARLYEAEMAKYRVERPEEDEDEDDETTFEKTFAGMLVDD